TNEPDVMHRDIAWSPDGTKLAYTANAAGLEKAFAVHVVDVTTGVKRAVTDGARDDSQPRWSPDGALLLFWSHRDTTRTNADLFVVPASGGEARRIETRGGVDGESVDGRWSPDGSRISFTTDTRGRQEIATAPYQGGTLGRIERMTDNIHDECGAVWRRDRGARAHALPPTGDRSGDAGGARACPLSGRGRRGCSRAPLYPVHRGTPRRAQASSDHQHPRRADLSASPRVERGDPALRQRRV